LNPDDGANAVRSTPTAIGIGLAILAVILLPLLLGSVFWRSLATPNAPEEPFFELVGSRHLAHVFFGFLFGVAAGYWVLAIFYRKPSDTTTRVEIAAGVAVLVFLLLGMAGEDAFVRMLERLSSVEVGGAKVSFSDASNSKLFATSAATETNGDLRAAPPAQSSGLWTIQTLPQAIGRDGQYASLLARASAQKAGENALIEANLINEFAEIQKSADGALSVPTGCLTGYANKTGDDRRIGRVLEPLAATMRDYFASSPSAASGLPEAWAVQFRSSFKTVQEEFKHVNGCAQDAMAAQLPAMLEPLQNDNWRNRPYFAIVFASMLEFDHQYVGALKSLSDALDAAMASKNALTIPVFELRLRALLAQYFDEWTSSVYGVKTPSVMAAQRENLADIVALLREGGFYKLVNPVLVQMKAKPSGLLEHAFLTDPTFETCSKPKDDLLDTDDRWNSALFLARTLISVKINWIFSALENPDYYDTSATEAEQFVDDFIGLNLQCLRPIASKSSIELKTEQILEAYARVKLANLKGTQKLQQIRGIEETKRGLELALAAIVLAEKLNKLEEADELLENGPDVGFLAKISTSEANLEKAYLGRAKIQIEQAIASSN
jgi:hypothetical protein